eukprot:TRINITY_DN8664_c0_g1_i1.p1 TRINITY_DN8664_c0_g1~~TRINITY_DN8664_c0_g1_i1.p1  ORF type:complete len:390 (+),score=97.53 TRINITY_DN8664_c0_g1_i1:264-1433(+)
MIHYDNTIGIVRTALHFHGTVIPAVLVKAEVYILLFTNVAVGYVKRSGMYHPGEYHMDLAMNLTQITGPLMTFFVVFYNGNVFARYQLLYELSRNMNENCLYIVSIADKELKNKALLRKLARLLLCSTILFFFERTRCNTGGHLSPKEWEQLLNIGLVTPAECRHLKEHTKKAEPYSFPSFLVLHWSMKLYRSHSNRIPDLDKSYFAVRKCQEEVMEVMDLPMPFQYFHIMNFMLMLNLFLWSYALALDDSVFAPLIYFFAQLMFQGLRELSVALSDPFGDDDTDFPLNEWMTQLYLRMQYVVEDDFEVHYDPHEPALTAIKHDEMFADLNVDSHPGKHGDGKFASDHKTEAAAIIEQHDDEFINNYKKGDEEDDEDSGSDDDDDDDDD